uniref:Doublecortin domain-containing protein n=1 Tax=Panagrellus redivivus TaxID=6233 RepID=A0A7E4W5E3_PANRE
MPTKQAFETFSFPCFTYSSLTTYRASGYPSQKHATATWIPCSMTSTAAYRCPSVYVASSSKVGGRLDLDAVERHQARMTEIANKRWELLGQKHNLDQGASTSRSNTWRAKTVGLFLPLTARQLFFILNGNPGRIHRVVLNPYRTLDFEGILEEASQGLGIAIWKLFTFSGERINSVDQLMECKENRILAVPRHEKPIFSGSESSTTTNSSTSLPPINAIRPHMFVSPTRTVAPRLSNLAAKYMNGGISGGYSTLPPVKNNSIERSNVAPTTRTAQIPPRRNFAYGNASTSTAKPSYMSSTIATSNHTIGNPGMANRVSQNPEARERMVNRRVMSLKQRRHPPPAGPAVVGEASTSNAVSTNLNNARNYKDPKKPLFNTQRATLKNTQRSYAPISTPSAFAKHAVRATKPTNAKAPKATTPNSGTASLEIDSDSGRPRSTDYEDHNDEKATNGTQTETETESDTHSESGSTTNDDFPELPDELASDLDSIQSPPPSRASKQQQIEYDYGDGKHHDAAVVIQRHTRGFLARKKLNGRKGTPFPAAKVERIDEEDEDASEKGSENGERAKSGAESEAGNENDKEDDAMSAKSTSEKGDSENGDDTMVENDEMDKIGDGEEVLSTKSAPDDGEVKAGENDENADANSLDYSEPEQSERPDTSETDAAGLEEVNNADIELPNEEAAGDERPETAKDQPEGLETAEDQPETANSRPESPENANVDFDPSKTAAATTIQKHWRGFQVRKNLPYHDLTSEMALPLGEEALIDTDEDEPKPEHDEFAKDDNDEDEFSQEEEPENQSYSIAVYTGIRWAGDTESDLYIILHGDDGESERFALRQTFINWLQSSEPRFTQGKRDEFVFSSHEKLGQLRKITIGHEHPGYGGGVFIDQVIVTEHEKPARKYLFQCYKWFDSGQVDGKLERSLRCTATYYLGPMWKPTKKSKGRWELLLHNGNDSQEGATTSNINIYGYGVEKTCRSLDIYDTSFSHVPSTSLVQVDFEEIGDLIKVRIEIDGNGDMPDYYLRYVELHDIDTDEHFEVNVGKWLRWESDEKNAQAFRELVVFRGQENTPPLYTYEGIIRVVTPIHSPCDDGVKLELFGTNGETGIFPVNLAAAKKSKKNKESGKYDVPFRIEAVSVGLINGIRIYFNPTKVGEAAFEALTAMQALVDATGSGLGVGVDFICSYIVVRESKHAPYRTVMADSKVQPRRENIPNDSYVKELRTTQMEGLSTKLPKSKQIPQKTPKWVVSLLLDDNSNLLPEVTLCGSLKDGRMSCLDATPTDNIVSYQLKGSKFGDLKKIRIGVDHAQRLNLPPEEIFERNRVYIQKLRVCDVVNGDELRLPVANIELFEYSIFELPVIWPDCPPAENYTYEVTVLTGETPPTGDMFYAFANLIGTVGDTGFRYLGPEDAATPTVFDPNSTNMFNIESVSIGEITTFEMRVSQTSADFSWVVAEVVVSDPTGPVYAFRFPEAFSAEVTYQKCGVMSLAA